MNQWVNLHALWQILVVGLIVGAGLPAIFTLGLRVLSTPPKGQPVDPESDQLVATHALGITVATICFGLTLLGIVWGIYFIVNG